MTKQETILIADDADINRAMLRALFEETYNILEAENGVQALMLLRQYSGTIAAVLLDLFMPERTGYDVLEDMQLEEQLCHIPVIVITADDTVDSRVRVFELGASDIIAKPFEPNVVKSRIKNIIELGSYRRHLEFLVAEQSARVQESSDAVIDMLSSVIEYRNLESGQHIRRIRLFTKILLEDVAKNYPEYALDDQKIRLITNASSMHDIGKIAIPDQILNKPGKLTAEEREVMKTHTTKGCEILSGLGRLQDREYLQYAYNICRYHHERWDGSGYPDGLKENSIPICAQVVALADCYDALTTDRVYKKAIPQEQAFNMILNGECGVFPPRLLECFKSVRNAFARLSKEYADGQRTPEMSVSKTLDGKSAIWNDTENMLELCQSKYFSVLKYLNSTVVEADFSTGVYHVVYLSDQSFSALRSGSNLKASLSAFVNSAVYPEDRPSALAFINEYETELFEEGLAQRDVTYRVLDCGTGAYFWCYATALRLNTENPHRHKALLIWHREWNESPADPAAANDYRASNRNIAVMNRLLGGVQKCRSDKYFTILQHSTRLVDLTGYTVEEIAQKFENHYIELIHPSDRKKVVEDIREQRKKGNLLELEYRLKTKDGRNVWISDRCLATEESGQEVFYYVLLDITRSHQVEEELRLALERHNIILQQTNDIIFEWDIKKDELYFSSNWEEKYGFAPITSQVHTVIPKASHIHPDDVPVFVSLMEAITAGVPYMEIEFRIADAEGRYRWRRVRATAQLDTDGKPFKAVGVLLDIDAEKKVSAELEKRAARDMLTGLYNKSYAQEKVKQLLEERGPDDLSALMVLDVDNFKHINDRYGHMFGDAVLTEMSAKVAGLFRGDDIVARIGGDEFMIYMPNVQREEIARRRAGEVTNTLQKLLQENVGGITFSCSIGLAFSSGSDISFSELFNQADRALYRAKASGKNKYVQYERSMKVGPVGLSVEGTRSSRTEIDSNIKELWSMPQFISTTFDMLYGATDFPEAVQSILSLVGMTFGVSRVYIFETAEDPDYCNNAYEWCADGICSYKAFQQNISYFAGEKDYRTNFNDNGIFYCQDIQKLPGWVQHFYAGQGILSTLQCSIQNSGTFRGFIGLDDCNIRRMWTREQIEALSFAGKLLGVFLMKHNAQSALKDSLSNFQDILDHQETWLYVVDPETYYLRYINRKTMKLVPDAQVGKPCYEAFHHRDRPCENCALQKAEKDGAATIEIYNPILKLWVLADASIVEWDNQNACLIACRDISAYKTAAGAQQQ